MGEEKEIRPAELTEELVDQIIFGMENQESFFLLDVKEGELIEDDEVSEADHEGEPGRFIDLPEWSPVDGFQLMERFVAHIKNPIYRQEMRDALNGGRGVFRRFKDVLKRYEPLERQWFTYKEREMRQTVRTWYATRNEAVQLERLGEEPEETEDLLLSDFVLKRGDWSTDERVEEAAAKAVTESTVELSTALRGFLSRTELPRGGENEKREVIYAETPPGDFAGCIAGVYHEQGHSLVLDLRFVYVEPHYRGLGLSRVLIDRITERARAKNASEVLFELLGNTLFLESQLEERGFREFGRRYSLGIDYSGSEEG